MNSSNDFFAKMCKEAIEELASGEVGWKEAETNTLFLACFGMLTNHLTRKIIKPLWCFSFSVAAGVVAYIIIQIIT